MTTHEIVTDAAAAGAVASPIWLPTLHQASEFAAMILPILGALWLALQIGLKIYVFVHRTRSK
jgi:hypothetical protein